MADRDPASSQTTRSNSGTPAPKAFKPRAGVQRRTKAEREKFAKEEAEREAKRAKEAARTAGTGAASIHSARGGRSSRGAAQSDRPRGDGTGGGIFGSSSGQKPGTRVRGALGAGSDELLEGSEAIMESVRALEAGKSRGTTSPTRTRKTVAGGDPKNEGSSETVTLSKTVEPTIEADEEPDEPRRDIERIWISSDEDEEEIMSGKGKGKAVVRNARPTGGLRPVRAPRTVKEDEADATSTLKMLVKPKTSAAELIDVDEMDVDEPGVIKEVPSSPELKKKNPKKPHGKAKDVKFISETVEERAERLRVNEDISVLRNIFAPTSTLETDGPSFGGGDGKLFLLQFPPLTPLLIDPNAPQEQDDDVVEIKQEGPAVSAPTANAGKAPVAKKDPDALNKKAPPPKPKDPHDHSGVFAACCPADRLASGLVGKLNVHASGKITLDWGGTDMEVRLGTEVDFLQDAVLVQTKKDAKSEESASGSPGGDAGGDKEDGKAFALGQIQGKMVVIPDWSKLYD